VFWINTSLAVPEEKKQYVGHLLVSLSCKKDRSIDVRIVVDLTHSTPTENLLRVLSPFLKGQRWFFTVVIVSTTILFCFDGFVPVWKRQEFRELEALAGNEEVDQETKEKIRQVRLVRDWAEKKDRERRQRNEREAQEIKERVEKGSLERKESIEKRNLERRERMEKITRERMRRLEQSHSDTTLPATRSNDPEDTG